MDYQNQESLQTTYLCTICTTMDINKSTNTPGLWKNLWRPIYFTLVVDDFLIRCIGQEHSNHIMSALKMYYDNITPDWEGNL